MSARIVFCNNQGWSKIFVSDICAGGGKFLVLQHAFDQKGAIGRQTTGQQDSLGRQDKIKF